MDGDERYIALSGTDEPGVFQAILLPIREAAEAATVRRLTTVDQLRALQQEWRVNDVRGDLTAFVAAQQRRG